MPATERTFAPTASVTLNGSPLDPDAAGSITSVTVVAEPTALDHAALVIANPYPDMPFTHGMDSGLFSEGDALAVQLGYVDAMSTVFDGEITSITPSFPASGVPTLMVEAMNRLHRLTSPQRSETHHQVTDADVASKIAQRNGLTPAATATPIVHESLPQHYADDLTFLRGRADAIGYEISVSGKTLRFQPRADASAAQYQLVWGDGQGAAQSGSYPLQSIEPRLNARGPVTRVQVRGQDPLTRQLITGTAGPGSEDVVAGVGRTAAQVVQTAFGSDERVIVDRPVLSQQEATTTARTIFNDRTLDLVQATGVTVGVPGMRPGEVVELAGIGLRFSGKYYLVRVAHSLSSSGYITSFSARSGIVGIA